MAAPHVTGAFALLKSVMPSATVDEVEYALKAGGTPKRGIAWPFETPLIDVLAALDFLGEDPPLEGLPIPGLLTSNYSAAQSFIRLRNTDRWRGTVDMTIVDDESGETLAIWSRQLESGSKLQIAVNDIESEVEIELDLVGLTYSAYVVTNFDARLQHVVGNAAEGVLTNMSECADGFADIGPDIGYVHTSLIQQYPSLFLVHNTRSVAEKASFSIHDTDFTHTIGRVETPEIPPQSSILFAASDAYDAIDFVPVSYSPGIGH